MKRWVKADFVIKWEWHRGRLQGEENRGWYHIYWHGRELDSGFRSKREASAFLGAFLKKANRLRKEAEAKGILKEE